MFLRSAKQTPQTPTLDRASAPLLRVLVPEAQLHDPDLDSIRQLMPEGRRCEFVSAQRPAAVDSDYLLSLFINPGELDTLADQVLASRRSGRIVTLIIAINGSQIVALGQWLEKRANAGQLGGIRLMLESDVRGVARNLTSRMSPSMDENVIRMPLSTEVENSPHRNFYLFSPCTQALINRIRGFAQNGIGRACLLGGPGSGKTSMSYYYYLLRGKGQYVSVNLLAENTRDKAAIKSLLCGHVAGAFPGASARTGAFTQARDGVCFIDESHDISGPVMETLMEALDSNQYLPYGATAKRQLECSILFATNRSWTFLQNSVNIDEFTRLGAAVLQVPELSQREEDMIAVLATTLLRLGAKCTTWTAPTGLSPEAWQAIRDCRWHGNIRGLTRVLESAFVDTASVNGGSLIQLREIEAGIEQWEPKSHHSYQLYAPAPAAA